MFLLFAGQSCPVIPGNSRLALPSASVSRSEAYCPWPCQPHAKPQGLDPYCDFESYPSIVDLAKHEPTSYPSLVVPLYAQALLVCHHELKWPDPEAVIAINNKMYSRD